MRGWSADGVEPVYNLTVEDQPEFFANGILVHNCADALRYMLMGVGAGSAIVDGDDPPPKALDGSDLLVPAAPGFAMPAEHLFTNVVAHTPDEGDGGGIY